MCEPTADCDELERCHLSRTPSQRHASQIVERVVGQPLGQQVCHILSYGHVLQLRAGITPSLTNEVLPDVNVLCPLARDFRHAGALCTLAVRPDPRGELGLQTLWFDQEPHEERLRRSVAQRHVFLLPRWTEPRFAECAGPS